MTSSLRLLLGILAPLYLVACVSIGNTKFAISKDLFQQNYASIKAIAVEEAANNGFGTLTSEVKPSEFNDWKGSLFFQLKTANGTDQLFVDFERAEGGVRIWVHGAGTRSNPDSAAKSIQAGVARLVGGPGAPVPAAGAGNTSVALKATAPTVSTPQALAATSVVSDASPSSTRPAPNLKGSPVSENSTNAAASMSAVEVQQTLIDLKYLKGPADGKIGKGTVEALKKFQQANSLAVSGSLNAETLERLKAATRR